MKFFFYVILSFSICPLLLGQVTEDFTGEPLGGTSFTNNGVVFNTTGDLLISEFDPFPCNGGPSSNRYLDTGFGDGASAGVFGTIAPANPANTFTLVTSSPWCGWPGSVDGDQTGTGTIRFTGTKPDLTTVSEDITMTSPNFLEFLPMSLTPAIWDGVTLASLQLEFIAGGGNDADYFTIDDIIFGGVPLPVELATFSGLVEDDAVLLSWQTETETNNSGFEVQHLQGNAYQNLGFVEGQGTTLHAQHYTFRVSDVAYGRHTFRLKQVDFDGTTAYSEELNVTRTLADRYTLQAAYPNPFNPQTTFSLMVARDQQVDVGAYNMLGQRVETLFAGMLSGQEWHRMTFAATHLPSGAYVIRATGQDFADVQMVTLAK